MRPLTWSIAKLTPLAGLLAAASCMEQPVAPTRTDAPVRYTAPPRAVQGGNPGGAVRS